MRGPDAAFLRVSQYYILRGNVPFPRAGPIYKNWAIEKTR